MADRRRRSKNRGDVPARDDVYRPLLAGGEVLRFDIDRPGSFPGEKWHYRSLDEAFAHLAPQADAMVGALRTLPQAARGPHVVLEATIQPSYLASSYYPEELFKAANLYPVGTRQAKGVYRTKTREREDEPTKTYLLAGDDDAVESFAAIIARGPAGARPKIWDQIREFEHVGLRRREGVLRGLPDDAVDEEVLTWEALLTRFGADLEERAALGVLTLEQFARYVGERGGEIDRDYVRPVDELTFLPVSLSVGEARSVVEFNSLRVLRPMPRVSEFSEIRRATMRSAPRSPDRAATAERAQPTTPSHPGVTRVAVFDGGIDPTDDTLRGHVRLHDLSPLPTDRDGLTHGTTVTNAVLYGYAAPLPTRAPPVVAVDHYRLFPPPDPGGSFERDYYWMLDRIEERVIADGHRLVNLSVGPKVTVDEDGEPHRWTATLDKLAASHGVLFVTAVGNNGAFTDPRVCVPADMVNGISVGACTSRDPASAVARAAYSAIGPGRSGQRVVPTGVCFGGHGAEPFHGLGPHGALSMGEGTSLAAPLATHGIAGLAAGLGGKPRAETLRAFAAHYAYGDAEVGHDERHIGYGRLRETYNDIWSMQQHEVTLLYELDLTRHALIALPAPLPAGIPERAMIDIEYTVCYTSQIQLGFVAEYTRAGLTTTFRPHARRFTLYSGEKKPTVLHDSVDTEVDRALIAKLFKTVGAKLSAHPKSKSGARRARWEGDLRSGGKWETLVRTQHRLRAVDLFEPRLDVEYLARDGSQLLKGAMPPLPVSVLVTVRVPREIDLYALTRAQFPMLTELRPRVRLPAVAPVRIPSQP